MVLVHLAPWPCICLLRSLQSQVAGPDCVLVALLVLLWCWQDKHSRLGLEGMLARRRKLLKYLRRTDWDSYCVVISRLGLRDRVDLQK